MDLHDIIADDFATIVDHLRNVIIGGVNYRKCLRRSVTVKEAAASAGKYLTSDTVFHLDSAEYITQPKIGGEITDIEGDWTIIAVDRQTLLNRWKCTCRLLWIDPTQTVTIQKATYTKGTTGAIEPTWTVVDENVVAKIQIESASVETDNANRTSMQLATVYFAASQDLGPAYRIIGSSGEVLKVLSWEGFSVIDQLFSAKCEVSKWPQA